MEGGRTESVYFWRPRTPTRQRPEYSKYWFRGSTEIKDIPKWQTSQVLMELLKACLKVIHSLEF